MSMQHVGREDFLVDSKAYWCRLAALLERRLSPRAAQDGSANCNRRPTTSTSSTRDFVRGMSLNLQLVKRIPSSDLRRAMRFATVLAAVAALPQGVFKPLVSAQSFTSCNPLESTCPPNPALGRSATFDFTQGVEPQGWSSSSGSITSDRNNGAALTISGQGDSPTLQSSFYIMFGRVEFDLRAAPGVGIVSSAVLQSDSLDEIDWEWLGGDDQQVQSNYFGKGQAAGYNRARFHSAPGNQDSFKTYAIDWTAERIEWQIDGATVRTQNAADASGMFPQTPCYVKVGTWAGGGPGNAAGTVEWAGGSTDFSRGPFTMYVRSIRVTDYSTGSEYVYSDGTGTWQSIRSIGGQVNGH
ncbi:hypothetical protein VTO42DRAFT_6360 [Malbranchea cinnamomea]